MRPNLSRSVFRSLARYGLLTVSFTATSVRAAKVPAAVVAAAKTACAHPSLRAVGALWLADCAEGADGERTHALSAISGDGHATPLGDYFSHASAPARGFDARGAAHVKGAQVIIEQQHDDGRRSRVVWDLSVVPPRELSVLDGDGLVRYSERCGTDLRYPRCVTDLVAHGSECTEKLPRCLPEPALSDCDDILEPAESLKFTPVPLAPSSATEPWRCGVTVASAYYGNNPGHSSFDVVATAVDETSRQVRLHLRAHDTTPQPTVTRGDWQKRDHYEIWLSDRGTISAAQLDDQAAWCAAKPRVAQLIVAPHADGTIELDMGRRADRPLLTDLGAELEGGELVLTFRKGPLLEWLTSGAVTVAYSDSLAGTRQDTIIGTSRVRFNHAETFGRLLPSSLCP